MKKKNVYEKINSEEELMKFLNSIGVQKQLNKRKNLVLLDKASEVKLFISKDDGSYTDHKKIVIGIPTKLLIGLSKKKIILLLEGLTIHECYHNLRTVQSLWVKFIKDCGTYFAKEFNAPTLFCEIQAKELLNCVEDGRIERIASKESNYNSKCLAITNATFFNMGEQFITRKGSPEEELSLTISNFVYYAKFGVPIVGYSKFYKKNMKYFNKAKKHIFKFVEEDSFEKAIPHLNNAIEECYDLFKELFSKIDFNKVPQKKQDEIGEGCGSQDGKPSTSQSSNSSEKSNDSSTNNSDSNNKEGKSDNSNNGSDESNGSSNEGANTSDKSNNTKSKDNGSDSENANKENSNDVAENGNSSDLEENNENGSSESQDTNNADEKGDNSSKSKSDSNDKTDSNNSSREKSNKKIQDTVSQRNESSNNTIKEMMDSLNDIILNDTKYDESKHTADIVDVLKDIENSLEIELNDSIDTILESIERENKAEEERIKELNNEVDEDTLIEILNNTTKVNPNWANFKLRYIYQQDDTVLEAPKEFIKNAYRMREYFKKILEPQKKSINKNRRRGQIDRGNLWKYAVNDDRMFQRKNNPHNNDYAIYIMVDGSGSMGLDKFREAFFATMLLEEVLCDLVPLKIVMFNTSGHYIDHNIVKNFSDTKKGSYSYSFLRRNGSYGANADGLSIRFGTHELLKRKERDKMLIVLSDGQPNGSYGYHGQSAINDVRNAVDFARDNGIKVFNIMFGTSAERTQLASTFKYMYQKGIVSCEPEKISEELMRIIRLEIK